MAKDAQLTARVPFRNSFFSKAYEEYSFSRATSALVAQWDLAEVIFDK
jgi:hypothetical protein